MKVRSPPSGFRVMRGIISRALLLADGAQTLHSRVGTGMNYDDVAGGENFASDFATSLSISLIQKLNLAPALALVLIFMQNFKLVLNFVYVHLILV